MDLKKPVLELRQNHVLRGKYPVYVQIAFNTGHIVESRTGYYIMTLVDDYTLRFYGLSKFRNKYQKERDFSINIKLFKYYCYNILGKHMKEVILINENDYLPFRFYANVPTSFEGESNIAYLCKHFDSLGIKEISEIGEKDEK